MWLPNRHSWARAWHAKLWDSRDTSSNHHADNSSVCLLCLSPAWLMFVVFFLSLLFLSPQCRRIFLWDKPMVIYELRRFSALSIMTGQKDKLNVRALSYFHYSSWISSFFFFSSFIFILLRFVSISILSSNDGGDSSLFCKSFFFPFFYCFLRSKDKLVYVVRDLLAIY